MNERRLHTFSRLPLLNVANCFICSAAILFVRACLTASFCGFMPRYARSSLACDAGAIKANGPLCVTFAKGSWQRDASPAASGGWDLLLLLLLLRPPPIGQHHRRLHLPRRNRPIGLQQPLLFCV